MMSKKAVLLIVFLAMFALQCGRDEMPVSIHQQHAHSESSPAKNIVHLSAEARDLVAIETEKARLQECRSVLGAMGKVLAPQPQTAIVSHAFPARVAEIHVKIGDWVTERQTLITLESQEVGTAKSEFYKATADCELAKVSFERQQRLVAGEIVAKKNLLEAEAEYKVAQANLEAAHKRLHVLGFTEEQVEEIADTHQINPAISLYAPIAGKVIDIDAVLGAMVDQSTEILTIIDPRLLWVDAEIYEKDIARIEVGQEVEVTVPAYPGKCFRGKISYIGDVVNDQTRTITVRAEVDNERAEVDEHRYLLKPGMFAHVNIVLGEPCQMLVVPSAAILEEGNQKIVFVQQKEHFVRRVVEAGPVSVGGDYQQIFKGLNAREEVVTEGNHQLKSKLKAEVLEAAHVH